MKTKRRSKTAKVDRPTRSKSALDSPAGPQPEPVGRWGVVGLALLSYLLCLPLFYPLAWWPLGFVALTPWLVACGLCRRRFWIYFISYLFGAAFFLTHFHWLFITTPEGYVAGSLWLAIYFPLAAWPLRHLYRRRGWSLAIAFPLIWTGLEYVRSIGPLSFPWFLLGHSQIHLLPMIQIADLGGAFAVGFVVAAVNGLGADLLLSRSSKKFGPMKPTRRWRNVGLCVTPLLLIAALVYGYVQLARTQPAEGPTVSVVQGDFLLFTTEDMPFVPAYEKRDAYYLMMIKAARETPDLVVLPETPWEMYLNREIRELTPDSPLYGKIHDEKRRDYLSYVAESALDQHIALTGFVRDFDTHLVVGGLSIEPQADDAYPQEHRYNSAFYYAPGKVEPRRYDKIHRVLFGEYVPFRYNAYLHWLYRWLNDITPWGKGGYEYSITEGNEFTTFELTDRKGDVYKFGATICYEDSIPQVFRRFVVDKDGHKQVDFMLNISNDGWFGHGFQQPQHLVVCAFRAVENRVGVARAVNTGVSGFINPDGRWHDLVTESGAPRAGGMGFSTARVAVDPRVTFYSRYGDLWAGLCLAFVLLACVDALIRAALERRAAQAAARQEKAKG